ncbi:hypothetical protein QF034_007377 [Streptomyces africanus]|uniref:Uncharacterized protein n=1 Tax=Streptomyces africanus TaxID=231024 RepID=A0ABU0R0M0_9ACTN|nr:hypothetical protein [Streptomyces africanus]
METIIVQLPGAAQCGGDEPGRPDLIHLGPGDIADFGRGTPGAAGVPIVLPDPGVSRRAGQLEAAGD